MTLSIQEINFNYFIGVGKSIQDWFYLRKISKNTFIFFRFLRNAYMAWHSNIYYENIDEHVNTVDFYEKRL